MKLLKLIPFTIIQIFNSFVMLTTKISKQLCGLVYIMKPSFEHLAIITIMESLYAICVSCASARRYASGRLMKTSQGARQLISLATIIEVRGRVIM